MPPGQIPPRGLQLAVSPLDGKLPGPNCDFSLLGRVTAINHPARLDEGVGARGRIGISPDALRRVDIGEESLPSVFKRRPNLKAQGASCTRLPTAPSRRSLGGINNRERRQWDVLRRSKRPHPAVPSAGFGKFRTRLDTESGASPHIRKMSSNRLWILCAALCLWMLIVRREALGPLYGQKMSSSPASFGERLPESNCPILATSRDRKNRSPGAAGDDPVKAAWWEICKEGMSPDFRVTKAGRIRSSG